MGGSLCDDARVFAFPAVLFVHERRLKIEAWQRRCGPSLNSGKPEGHLIGSLNLLLWSKCYRVIPRSRILKLHNSILIVGVFQ